ncbi:MAG TPA: HPr family phosphocarrier protein [Phycisphaerales bacterium]|nr:HPr family phosphocarrier protein [Phycisphaerales bacterium]
MSDRASTRVKIVNKLGLHARPAMSLAEIAKKYDSDVALKRGDQKIDAKSVMEIMLLAATFGTELLIEAEGEDARECVEALRELIDRGFDEE